VNINYYDVILGTLFLRRLRVALDFTGPGVVCIGTAIVPCNFPLGLPDEKVKWPPAPAKQPLKPPE